LDAPQKVGGSELSFASYQVSAAGIFSGGCSFGGAWDVPGISRQQANAQMRRREAKPKR
jgi:hypothetical protein